MKLSLVVPCYNEADNVELFYEKVEATFRNEAFDYEYILSMMVVGIKLMLS